MVDKLPASCTSVVQWGAATRWWGHCEPGSLRDYETQQTSLFHGGQAKQKEVPFMDMMGLDA